MATIEDVLSDIEKQRRSWDEFKAAQNMRLSIAEKEIRALLVKTDQSYFCAQGRNQKHIEGHTSC